MKDASDTKPEVVEVSVVMPCLNEAETVATCVRKAVDSFRRLGVNGEVVVADNGSSDGSQELARQSGARIVDIKERGYGNALRGGILAARGRYVIMGDSDDSYDFSDIGGIIGKLRESNDLVMGCRLPRGGGSVAKGAMPWSHRWIGNPMLTFLGRTFFRARVHDFYCGLRGFSADAFRRLNLRTTGMEFALEMVAKASLMNMKVAEVPITLHPDGRSRPPHLRTLRDGWRSLRFFLMYSPRWLFVYPGLLLIIAGALGSAWLLPGTRSIGNVKFDAHSLLVFASFCVIGFQLLWFAIFAKMFAITEQLLPDDPRFRKAFGVFTLEVLLLIGAFLVVLGVGLLVGATWYWRVQAFGALDYSRTMRVVIPGVVVAMVGMQTIFSSFLLGLMQLSRKSVHSDDE